MTEEVHLWNIQNAAVSKAIFDHLFQIEEKIDTIAQALILKGYDILPIKRPRSAQAIGE